MKSSTMINELHYLGIDEADIRLLLLIPLLQVAWADAQVVHREQAVVRAAAQRLGLTEGERGKQVNAWLTKRPTQDYLRRARTALRELAGHSSGLGADINVDDLVFVLEAAREVALAGSGMFGFLRYEAQARDALDEIMLDLSLENIDFEFDLGWEFTEEMTQELLEEAKRELTGEEPAQPHVSEELPRELSVEMTDEAPPGFLPGQTGFALGLEEFLVAPDEDPPEELLEMVRETDLRDELMQKQVGMLAKLLLKGDTLPEYCALALVKMLGDVQQQLNLPTEAASCLGDERAFNAVHKAGWDMAHSVRYGGAFSGSVVIRDRIVLRTTAYRQPPADLPPVFAHEGGYLKLLARLHSVSGISEHYGVQAPETCTHFVHVVFCLDSMGKFSWLPVVVPLGKTPGKIVLAPQLLSEAERRR